MQEMSKAAAHPPAKAGPVRRPVNNAKGSARTFAVALDRSGKVHFARSDVGGDHAIVLLGNDVPDSHLAELAADGVSYVVADEAEIDLAAALDVLAREFGIKHLVVEGGAVTNGEFLASGLVDEMRISIAPALDAGDNVQGIVAYKDGLAGKVRLQFKSVTTLDHGVVDLHYSVLPAEA